MKPRSVEMPMLVYLELGPSELEIVGRATYSVFPDSFGVRGSDFVNVDLLDYSLSTAFFYYGDSLTASRPADELLFFLRLCFPGVAAAIDDETDRHLVSLEDEAPTTAMERHLEGQR